MAEQVANRNQAQLDRELNQNQVSGHSSVSSFPQAPALLFKPLMIDEYTFYNSLVDAYESLRAWVPTYMGVYKRIPADPHKPLDTATALPAVACARKLPPQPVEVEAEGIRLRLVERGEAAAAVAEVAKNAESNNLVLLDHFIAIENGLDGMKFPCICDFKCGVRQHGLRSPEWEILAQVEKITRSTCSTFALKYSGSVEWTRTHQDSPLHREQHSKASVLTSSHLVMLSRVDAFVSDGLHLRRNVARVLKAELEALGDYLTRQQDYCFWSGSVLLMYDAEADPALAAACLPGHTTPEEVAKMNDSGPVRIRLIDFAKSASKEDIIAAEGRYVLPSSVHWLPGETPPATALDQGAWLGVLHLVEELDRVLNDPNLV